MDFEKYEIRSDVLKAIGEMGFETMTLIQEAALPIAMAGKDLIGQAQTGTGKTTAFTIPILEQLSNDEIVQALILTPTRELCIQVEREVYRLSKFTGLRSLAIYGGQEIERQIRALKNRPQIIVATPGRLMDHMRRRTIRLEHLKILVLDEADEMLNMGFLEDIETILQACPDNRQTLMFSATMRSEIQRIAKNHMCEPEYVKVAAESLTVPAVAQEAYIVYEDKKLGLLSRLLEMIPTELTLVFGRTKRRVDELTRALQTLGYRAEGLHGDLSQSQRDQVMRKFREKRIDVLVATDVASRGLDVEGVSHVFNFDLPQDADNYVHRIGRTGRAGSKGLAISFATPHEKKHLYHIEKAVKSRIKIMPLPTEGDSRVKQNELLRKAITSRLGEPIDEDFQLMASYLGDEYGAEEVLALTLSILAGKRNREREAKKIKLTSEKPVFSKANKGRSKGYQNKKSGRKERPRKKQASTKRYKFS